MCVCAHLGYLVVHAFYYNLPFSFLDSATLIYYAIDLIADLNWNINNLMQYCKLYYINVYKFEG